MKKMLYPLILVLALWVTTLGGEITGSIVTPPPPPIPGSQAPVSELIQFILGLIF